MKIEDEVHCPVNGANHLYDTKPLAKIGGKCIYCGSPDKEWKGPIIRIYLPPHYEAMFDRKGELIQVTIHDIEIDIWKL